MALALALALGESRDAHRGRCVWGGRGNNAWGALHTCTCTCTQHPRLRQSPAQPRLSTRPKATSPKPPLTAQAERLPRRTRSEPPPTAHRPPPTAFSSLHVNTPRTAPLRLRAFPLAPPPHPRHGAPTQGISGTAGERGSPPQRPRGPSSRHPLTPSADVALSRASRGRARQSHEACWPIEHAYRRLAAGWSALGHALLLHGTLTDYAGTPSRRRALCPRPAQARQQAPARRLVRPRVCMPLEPPHAHELTAPQRPRDSMAEDCQRDRVGRPIARPPRDQDRGRRRAPPP